MRPCPEDSLDKKIKYPIIWKRKEKELTNTMINAQICSANAAFPVAKTTHHIEVAKDSLTKSCRWVGRLDRYIINESFKILNDLFYGPMRQNNLSHIRQAWDIF